jgi:hypothetical protein
MSLTSLVDEEVIRTDQLFLRERLGPRVGEYVQRIAPKYSISGNLIGDFHEDLLPLAAEPPTERTKASNALDSLVRYLPTEVITLYVAASAAMSALTATFPVVTGAGLYWSFGLLLTPTLFLLVFAGKRRSSGLPAFPSSLRRWPWWKLGASTVAFLVWALAIPTTPYMSGDAGKVVAAFAALLVSTFLTLLEPIFERPRRAFGGGGFPPLRIDDLGAKRPNPRQRPLQE